MVGAQGVLKDVYASRGDPVSDWGTQKNVIYPGTLSPSRDGIGDQTGHLLEGGVVEPEKVKQLAWATIGGGEFIPKPKPLRRGRLINGVQNIALGVVEIAKENGGGRDPGLESSR